MSELIISARDLTKVYRLYTKPQHRFLDMFGLLRGGTRSYTEHVALNRVSLEVQKGEKVAIIGRNGAGKSTLLKLVTGVIEPSSGSIQVAAKAHALLQIGSGFHPDFTGRENVYAYLAQLGVSGTEARRMCDEIIDFAELEEYIDQPVKTYSSGMAVRLMFSTSTAITPDLLVLDEVLGVGDAYFAQKSYDRMKEMCEGSGTTLLLVTHDIYSAAKLCARMVWIDAGKVVIDGDVTTVIKSYEDSIRAQEERRLRVRQQARLAAVTPKADDTSRVLLEIRAANNRPQAGPVYFSRIALQMDGQVIAEVPIGAGALDQGGGHHLVKDAGRWGDVEVWRGRETRPMLNYGGSFHKVGAMVSVPRAALTPDSNLVVRIEHGSDHDYGLELVAFVEGAAHELGTLPQSLGEWTTHELPWHTAAPSAPLQINPTGDQGAGDILITGVRLVNAIGAEVRAIEHGAKVSFELDYRVARSPLRERAQVFLVISRNNTERVCKFLASDLIFDDANPTGKIRMTLPKMMLSAGTYELAAEIAAEGYIERGTATFFSIDPSVYHCLTHALEFTVTTSGWIGDYTVFEGYGEWELIHDTL